MIEAAEVKPGDRVLEVGAGSGYAAAVLPRLPAVYAIERHPSLAEPPAQRFRKLGYDNIELRVGDGTLGWAAGRAVRRHPGRRPADRSAPGTRRQLAIGGRLVIPVGA